MEQSKTLELEMFDLSNLNKDYIERKHWGYKYNLHYSSSTNTDLLFFDKGGFTSKHYHNNKINRLFCVYGFLKVEYIVDGNREIDVKFLSPVSASRIMDIMPKVIHRLTAIEKSLVIEIDSPKPNTFLDIKDIVRLDKGMKE